MIPPLLRAISDTVDGSNEVEYAQFEKEAAARCAAITQYMLEHWTDPVE